MPFGGFGQRLTPVGYRLVVADGWTTGVLTQTFLKRTSTVPGPLPESSQPLRSGSSSGLHQPDILLHWNITGWYVP